MGIFESFPELIWLIEIAVCFTTVVLIARWFGLYGLYTYNIVAIIMVNVQVLKVVKFDLYSYPIPLGTILLTSTFLTTDVIVEFFGVKAAKRGIYLGFLGFGIWTLFAMLTLSYPVQSYNQVVSHAMDVILSPSWRLFVAGMTAFVTGQLLNIYIFDWIKSKTGDKWLWLRNTSSTLIALLIDNIIFSVLAWVVLAKDPVSWSILVGTYIIGTYWFRAIFSFFATPFIYCVKYFALEGKKPKHLLID